MVQNARFDIRGYNRAYCRLVGIDLAEIPEEDRNCIYLALTHERWRYCMANREEALPRMVGFFRAAMVERMGDPLWGAAVAALPGGFGGVPRDLAAQ